MRLARGRYVDRGRLGQISHDVAKWQPHYVRETFLHSTDIDRHKIPILDGIGPRLVKRIAAGQVVLKIGVVKFPHRDAAFAGIDDLRARIQVEQRDAGDHPMASTPQVLEHPPGILQVFRLTEQPVSVNYDGIRSENQARHAARRHRLG